MENRNEIERYLIDSCRDSNDDKINILNWWKNNASEYKIFSNVSQHVLVILVSTLAFNSAFSTYAYILDQFFYFFNLQ